MESQQLVEAMGKLDAKGITLEQFQEETKIPANIIRLYAVGGLVPDRIVKKMEELVAKD